MTNPLKMPMFKSVVCLLLMIGIITSCEQDEIVQSPDSSKQSAQLAISQDVKQQIRDLGYEAESVVSLDDEYYVVDGHVLLNKDLSIYKSKSTPNGHARFSSLINYANQNNITVRVDASIPTGGVDDWRAEVQSAIGYLNSIRDTRIRFIYTTSSTADITVRADNSLSPSLIAVAEPPVNGNAGTQVRVNLNFWGNMTVSTDQKAYNMVHEFGHCIGLRHTNWRRVGETTVPIDIPGTPTAGNDPDPSSVFNGGTALNSWIGFSSYDVIAITKLYPAFTLSIVNFPSSPVANQNYSISASSPEPGLTYSWSVGGGILVSGQGTATIVAKVGSPVTFGVMVTATNASGQTVTVSKWVP